MNTTAIAVTMSVVAANSQGSTSEGALWVLGILVSFTVGAGIWLWREIR
jgi:predicted anti-sigma-YlaC factor YlaD